MVIKQYICEKIQSITYVKFILSLTNYCNTICPICLVLFVLVCRVGKQKYFVINNETQYVTALLYYDEVENFLIDPFYKISTTPAPPSAGRNRVRVPCLLTM